MSAASEPAEVASTIADEELLDGRISLLVHRLNSRFTQIANQLISTRGLNMYDSRILLFILERKEMRVGELVETMALPQSTISQQLTRLKAKRLIRRRRTRGDNRAVVITLTPAGEEAARASEVFSRVVQRRINNDLSRKDVQLLRHLLNRTYDILSKAEIVPDEALKPMKPTRARFARRRASII